MRWSTQSLLACGAVIPLALALIISLFVIIAFIPGLRGSTISTQPGLHSGIGRIAFVGYSNTGARDIFVMNADGSGQVNLTNSPETDSAPIWSPDGSHIMFTASEEDRRRIMVTNLNGAATSLIDRGWSPAWSPDGERIVFVSDKDGPPDLYLVAVHGSSEKRLTNNLVQEQRPLWSPNGQHIAFFTGQGENVYIVDADGTNQRKIGDGDTVTWSPDSTQLAFTSTQENVGIQVTDVMGTPLHTIAGVSPHWSPDGNHITFLTRFEDSLRASLGVVQADGSHSRILVEDIPWWTDVQWSPDGEWLVFTNGLTLEVQYPWINIINVDGSDQTRLVDGSYPVWQPQP